MQAIGAPSGTCYHHTDSASRTKPPRKYLKDFEASGFPPEVQVKGDVRDDQLIKLLVFFRNLNVCDNRVWSLEATAPFRSTS